MRGAALIASLALAGSLWAGAAAARCENYTPQPRPQNTARDVVGQELDTIVERGFISFAVYEDFPPYSYEEAGRPAGVDVEIGKLIADELGVEARFQLVAAGENLQADLRNWLWKGPVVGGSVANVMLHVPYDSELTCRVEQVVFTGQYYEESLAVAYRLQAFPDGPPVPIALRFGRVGVENDSISDFYLSDLGRGALHDAIVRFADAAAAMAALAQGKVDAVMAPRAQLEAGLTEESAVHEPPLMGFPHASWTVGLGVHHAYRPLAYAVGDAITAGLQDGRIAKIFEDHGLTFSPPTW